MAEAMAIEDDLEFAWGKKRRMGGKKKDVQFYESFTFDGTEYTLNDAVLMQNASGGEPFIGRLIKIWETRDKSRKVKVQWFFRPSEIRIHLHGIQTRHNELFLSAGGDGAAKGFANVNPLETIVGKCNVVCISNGVGNPRLLDDANADFVFYRFFDVVQLKVVDQIDDKAAADKAAAYKAAADKAAADKAAADKAAADKAAADKAAADKAAAAVTQVKNASNK